MGRSQFIPFLSACLAVIFLMITSDQSMQSRVCQTHGSQQGDGVGVRARLAAALTVIPLWCMSAISSGGDKRWRQLKKAGLGDTGAVQALSRWGNKAIVRRASSHAPFNCCEVSMAVGHGGGGSGTYCNCRSLG